MHECILKGLLSLLLKVSETYQARVEGRLDKAEFWITARDSKR